LLKNLYKATAARVQQSLQSGPRKKSAKFENILHFTKVYFALFFGQILLEGKKNFPQKLKFTF